MNAFRTVLALITVAFAAHATAVPIRTPDDPAIRNAIVIDFNMDIHPFTSLTLGNVTFQTDNGYLTLVDYKNLYGTSGFALGNPSAQSFDAIFGTTVSAFDVVVGAINGGWKISAYDVNNKIIETLSINDPCCGGYTRGIAAPGIKRVSFTPVWDYAAFDNFRFVPTQVPEPGSLALMGLGLLGFAALRRKKD